MVYHATSQSYLLPEMSMTQTDGMKKGKNEMIYIVVSSFHQYNANSLEHMLQAEIVGRLILGEHLF